MKFTRYAAAHMEGMEVAVAHDVLDQVVEMIVAAGTQKAVADRFYDRWLQASEPGRER